MKTDHAPPLAWDGQDVQVLLSLEPLDENLFRSRYNQRNSNGALYGGQVFGQALAAAMGTVEGRAVHSCHGYFLRPGDAARRVILEVERTRDGGSFSSRRVVALQNGLPILHLECSFHAPEAGFEHGSTMPDVPMPEELGEVVAQLRAGAPTLPPFFAGLGRPGGPIEILPANLEQFAAPLARRRYWMRVSRAATDEQAAHRVMLAYLSDWWFSGVALMPHAAALPAANRVFISSIDHAIWFHRDVRADEWLLFDADSPSASHGVGLARGLVYDRAGRLVASTAQEALLRQRR